MNFLKNKYTYLVIASMFMFSSCDDYLDINDNPNNPTEALISALMVNSTFETAQNTLRMGDVFINYVQHLASKHKLQRNYEELENFFLKQ